MIVDLPGGVVENLEISEAQPDFEAVFHRHYGRIARAIARLTGDRSRAEELAMDVFWKYWRLQPDLQSEKIGGWLYRAAINLGLGELRRRARHARFQRLARFTSPHTPEQLHAEAREQQQVRLVLAALRPREAEILVLRSHDFSYEELASALRINPASIGTLIARAREAFRKEYTKRYGEPQN